MADPLVSVNAYNDADLLQDCLSDVRRHLPDAPIHVVDGRYESWPDAADNSTDDTAHVAESYGASYDPAGPFEDESAKHRYRRDSAVSMGHDRVLFLDADERLIRFDADAVDHATDTRVRIFNALLYGPRISYYPRYFDPTRMSVDRVDKFMFDGPVRRTDAITIVHRADLRGDDYREAKLERFEAEKRETWYRDYLDSLPDDGPDADFQECPNCGRRSVTESRVTGYERRDSTRNWEGEGREIDLGETFTRIRCCTAGDGCYREIVPVEFDEYRYVPDAVEEGFAEDVERVKLELMAAGYDLAKVVPVGAFDRYEHNARKWVRENLDAAAQH